MVSGLFDEFSPVDDDHCFAASFMARGDSTDQLCKDNLV